MAKIFCPFTTKANSFPHSSFSVLTVMVRKPILYSWLSKIRPSISRNTSILYRGCSPYPLGHQRAGSSISRHTLLSASPGIRHSYTLLPASPGVGHPHTLLPSAPAAGCPSPLPSGGLIRTLTCASPFPKR